MATDPVCGMPVDESTAAGSSLFAGGKYSFFSARCKQKFEANPSAYVGTPLPVGDSVRAGHAHHPAYTAREPPGHVPVIPVVAGTVPPGKAFFTKPYNSRALISAVSEAIRRPEGSWVGPLLDPVREKASMDLEASAKSIDPVCRIEVIPFQSAGKSEHEGHIYYFCTPARKQLFEQSPRRYTDKG